MRVNASRGRRVDVKSAYSQRKVDDEVDNAAGTLEMSAGGVSEDVYSCESENTDHGDDVEVSKQGTPKDASDGVGNEEWSQQVADTRGRSQQVADGRSQSVA